jgi:hypothetical protein
MKLFRKIDTTTGNFIEDCLFESRPILTETVLVDVTDEEGTTIQVEELQLVLDAEGNTQLDPQYIKMDPIEWTLKKVPSIGSIFVYLKEKNKLMLEVASR